MKSPNLRKLKLTKKMKLFSKKPTFRFKDFLLFKKVPFHSKKQ
jgi:hypothetical protein